MIGTLIFFIQQCLSVQLVWRTCTNKIDEIIKNVSSITDDVWVSFKTRINYGIGPVIGALKMFCF